MEDGTALDELLFMTGIPWVSPPSFLHPINLDPVDSVAWIAYGKSFQEGDSMTEDATRACYALCTMK